MNDETVTPERQAAGPIEALSVRKRVIMTACLLLCIVFMLEGVLQLAAAVSPRVRLLLAPPWSSLRQAAARPSMEPTVPDALLGHRPRPGYPGHDANGFRNPAALDTADIVALGDSHTYGTNVEPRYAWTRQLADSLGQPIYNMAYGGYGPTHELALLPEALRLRPRLILVGIYAGNDLYDCYHHVYELHAFSEFATTDPTERARIAAAETDEPVKEKVEKNWRALYGDMLVENTSATSDASAANTDAPSAIEPPLGPRRLISEYSKLYGLARATKDALAGAPAEPCGVSAQRWAKLKSQAATMPGQCAIFESGDVRTIFTPRVRLDAMNLDDARIAEGCHIALHALRTIQQQAAAAGATVRVVFLPTKEYVFADAVRESSRSLPPEYEALVTMEARLWSELRTELTALHVECIDPVPALRAALRAGQHPYPADRDGHPTAAGHRVIARVVEDILSSETWRTVNRHP